MTPLFTNSINNNFGISLTSQRPQSIQLGLSRIMRIRLISKNKKTSKICESNRQITGVRWHGQNTTWRYSRGEIIDWSSLSHV